MAFSITAELPLGTYRGHLPDKRVERLPSVARLHSALLCAAGFGPRARLRDGELHPADADEAALRWLEDNPPDAVAVPALEVNRGTAIAYRDDGTVSESKGRASVQKNQRSAGTSVAVQGHFVWTWRQTPPPEIVSSLEALCPEVPYLGTTESPVRLTTSRDEGVPTHILDPAAGLFTGAGVDVELPVSGRVDELINAHADMTSRRPTLAQDKRSMNESSVLATSPRRSLRPARYAPVQAPAGDGPWSEVLVLPLDAAVPEHRRVGWAVAAHRALIKLVGEGAPPLLTGTYPSGVARPANRIALHVVDPGQSVNLRGAPAALAVLLPRGAESGDLVAVLAAVGALRSVRGPGGAVRKIDGATECVPGDGFWSEPAPGTVRLWRASPPAVPDTRGWGPSWSFAHAALLSLGFVWQGSAHLPAVPGRGLARDQALVTAVNAAGAAVLSVEPLRTSAVGDYVHRVHPDAVVRPYRVSLTVGALGGDRTVQAIGQSRHLGGGLLVPVDVPEGTPVDMAGAGA